ncbi:hypothetical protein M2324_000710, partial [Rhodovulum sulfidophilum]|nr:hypothetical protein [Rhodovulum sulfidophilum]
MASKKFFLQAAAVSDFFDYATTPGSGLLTDDAHRVLDGLKTVAMHALLLQRPDEAFDHA